MILFHSSFYFVRYRILFKCWKQIFRNQKLNIRLIIFSFFFTLLFFIHQLLNLFFRSVDELIFFRYRKVKIIQPVFIIANPRSGTSYLHKLISKDDRFIFMKLSHTIFPAVSFVKLYLILKSIDKTIGNPLLKMLKIVDKTLYKGWDNIHPMGFNSPEEDEALFTLALTSPAIFLLFPFMHLVKDNNILDHENEKVKEHMMNNYINSLKRYIHASGSDKIYLSKNVLSSGRINCLQQKFPDAKFIYLVRHPYETLPSFISMFTVMYHVHSPNLKNSDAAIQAWSDLGIEFYKHFHEAGKTIREENLCIINYNDLVTDPSSAVAGIYNKFNWNIPGNFKIRLEREIQRNKNYRSKHQYTLEQYGLHKEKVYDELKFLFDELGFDK